VSPLPEAPGTGNAYLLLKAAEHVDRMFGPCPGSRKEAGEILPSHVYRKEEERRCELLPGLVPFRLV
jgi:hypothetical protein